MLIETLNTNLVSADLGGSDKPSGIRALLELLLPTGKIADPELALKDAKKRRKS